MLAEDLLTKWFKTEQESTGDHLGEILDKKIPFRKIANEYSRSRIEGFRYEPLFNYARPTDGDAYRVLLGDFVSTEDGTGIVHIAPSFGADDMRVAKIWDRFTDIS